MIVTIEKSKWDKYKELLSQDPDFRAIFSSIEQDTIEYHSTAPSKKDVVKVYKEQASFTKFMLKAYMNSLDDRAKQKQDTEKVLSKANLLIQTLEQLLPRIPNESAEKYIISRAQELSLEISKLTKGKMS